MNWKFWTWGRRQTNQRRTHIAALLTEEQRVAAFVKAPGNDLFAAIIAELDELTMEVSDRAVDESISADQMRFRLGAQDGLLEFKEKLLRRESDARLTQAQLEAKAREEQSADDAD